MAIEPGSYTIVSAMNTSRAIDVNGASDARGANVQIWTLNRTHAQYATVTGEGESQIIRFPLTGRVMDVSGAQARNGANIIQWDGNDGLNQSWNIVPDSQMVSISGASYPTYIIRSAMDQRYVVDVSGQQTSPGTNVTIWTANGGNNQRWAFIPEPLLPVGDYMLVSAIDRKSCLSAADLLNGGSIVIAGVDHEDNRQIWSVANNQTVTTLRNRGSGGYLHATSATAGYGLDQQAKASGNLSLWFLQSAGKTTLNGATCPLVMISLQAGNALAVDAADGGNSIVTYATIQAEGNRNGVKFIAVPTLVLDESMAAPADPGLASSIGSQVSHEHWGTGSISKIATWIGQHTEYQLRSRSRVRRIATDDDLGEWSAWSSNGSSANDGWGDVTKANCRPTIARDPDGVNRCYGPTIQHTVNTVSQDLVECQFQVRAMTGSGRGNVTTSIERFVYRPTAAIDAVEFGPMGISLSYHADQPRNGNRLTVFSMMATHAGARRPVYRGPRSGYSFDGIPHTGAVFLPLQELSSIPEAGDQVSVIFRYTNIDGAYSEARQESTISATHASGKDLPMTPTASVKSDLMLEVTSGVSSPVKEAIWIGYADRPGILYGYPSKNGSCRIPIRLGVGAYARVLSQKGNRWNVKDIPIESIDDLLGYHLNYEDPVTGEPKWIHVEYGAGAPPTINRTITPVVKYQPIASEAREVVTFGSGYSEPIELSSAMPLSFEIPNCDIGLFEDLVNARYAWLRGTYLPDAYRVAVTGVAFSYSANPDYTTVRLSLRRVDDPRG